MLKLSQASELTGRHEDTIRRIIKKLLKTDPQAQEKIKQEQTVRGFHYLIDEEYLLKHLQPLQQPFNPKNGVTPKTASYQPYHQSPNKGIQQPPQQGLRQPTHAELKAKDETIALLKKEIEVKNEQIRQFQERDRETNVLLKGYQDKLDKFLIEAPKEKREGETGREKAREATTPEKPKSKQSQKVAKQPKKTEKIQPQKKSFWSSLFGT